MVKIMNEFCMTIFRSSFTKDNFKHKSITFAVKLNVIYRGPLLIQNVVHSPVFCQPCLKLQYQGPKLGQDLWMKLCESLWETNIAAVMKYYHEIKMSQKTHFAFSNFEELFHSQAFQIRYAFL